MAKKSLNKYVNDNIAHMQRDICEIKEAVKENTTILNGRGNEPGLVGKFEIFKQELSGKIDSVKSLLTNDLAHISARMDLEFSSREKLQLALEEKRNVIDKENVTHSELLKEWLKPVVVAILVSILTYLITNGL